VTAATIREAGAVRDARPPAKRADPMHGSRCLCRGSGWVCEDHPTVPFATEIPVTCWCDAPGMPCPGIQDAPCEVCGITVAAVFIARTGERRHGHHRPDEPSRRVRRVVRRRPARNGDHRAGGA
jgi:hypothetical protein